MRFILAQKQLSAERGYLTGYKISFVTWISEYLTKHSRCCLFIGGSHSENRVDELLRPIPGTPFHNFILSVTKIHYWRFILVWAYTHIYTHKEYVCLYLQY